MLIKEPLIKKIEWYRMISCSRNHAVLMIDSAGWHTYDKKEIDWIEDRGGNHYGYEIKWNEKDPKEWLATYSNASYEVINRNNYFAFVS